jgi:hypothetical protein
MRITAREDFTALNLREGFKLYMFYDIRVRLLLAITVAVLSKIWTVFVRSNTGIVGPNTTRGMDICVRLFCVCLVRCVGTGFAHVGFCDGQKWRCGRFSLRTSVSPANLHSMCFSTIIFIITRGWHNRPVPIASQTRIKKNTFPQQRS